MGLNNFLEPRLGWLAFPGLIRAIALLQAVFFVVLVFNPAAGSAVSPDWSKVLQGEVWRLFGFIFYPPVPPGPDGSGQIVSALFMFIAVSLSFLINDSLEHAWGEFRTSMYVYGTIICQSIAFHFFGSSFLPPPYYIALFFAFATVFPRHELLLFLIIPVKVWILAAFTAVLMFLGALAAPSTFLFLGLSFLPYLIWVLPRIFQWRKNRSRITMRRNEFETAHRSSSPTLHRCSTCNRTEVSDPDLEFRVADNDEEYCLDHIPSSSNPSS